MFEPPLNEEPKTNKGIWIGAAVVVVLAIALLIYFTPKTPTRGPAPVRTASVTAANQKADPVRDLRIVSSQMQKDQSGAVAQWVVGIHNVSPVFTYTSISYQTTYAAADNSVLSQNDGVMTIQIGPNEEKTAQFSDVQYPTGTSWYRIRVVDAKASQ